VRGAGVRDGELCQRLARNDLPTRLVLLDGQGAFIDPAADGVVADAENVSGVAHP